MQFWFFSYGIVGPTKKLQRWKKTIRPNYGMAYIKILLKSVAVKTLAEGGGHRPPVLRPPVLLYPPVSWPSMIFLQR